MVLEDVPDRARLLVERRAALDPDRLRDGDLHVVDELPVPDRLEDPVREAQRQQVLDGLLAEVVVDAEDLALGEVLADQRGQLLRRGEVVAERLLDDQPRSSRSDGTVADHRDERLEGARRDGEVVEAVSRRAALALELGEASRRARPRGGVVGGRVEHQVAHPVGQLVPHLLPERVARVLLDGVLHRARGSRRPSSRSATTPTTANRSGSSRRNASE